VSSIWDQMEHDIVPAAGIAGFGPDRVRCSCGAVFMSTWEWMEHADGTSR